MKNNLFKRNAEPPPSQFFLAATAEDVAAREVHAAAVLHDAEQRADVNFPCSALTAMRSTGSVLSVPDPAGAESGLLVQTSYNFKYFFD